MVGLKCIYFKSIKRAEYFEDVNGSYYDYVAKAYSFSENKHKEMCEQLTKDDWKNVKTNNGITVFLKDRHIIRIFPIWG